MKNFNYYLPTSIRYGWGRVNEIGINYFLHKINIY